MTQQEQRELEQNILEYSRTPGYFSALVGLEYESISVRGGVGYVTATKELCNPYGILHGGVYYTLMDQLAGMAACCSGQAAVTLDANINYIRSARLGDRVKCELTAVHVGRSVIVYDAKCTGPDGRLQATGCLHLFLTEQPVTDIK